MRPPSQKYSQPGTPRAVRSIRESSDLNTANMAMRPSFQGILTTDEQENQRDKTMLFFGDNVLIRQQQHQIRATTNAMTSFRAGNMQRQRGHVAMTAKIDIDKMNRIRLC